MRFFRHRSTHRRIAALVAVVLIEGCAAMYDPPARAPHGIPWGAERTPEEARESFAEGMRYAYAKREAYLRAATRDQVKADYTALGVILMGAAALGLGVTGTTGDPLTALGLAGGTTLGLGRWFTSKERRNVFGIGAGAIGCVIRAAEPFDVPEAQVQTIQQARERLVVAMWRLQDLLDGFEPSRLPRGATEARDKAVRVMTAARDTLKQADHLLMDLHRAGAVVVEAVESVRVEITKAALDTARDLDELEDFLKSSIKAPFGDIVGMARGPKEKSGELQGASLNAKDSRIERLLDAAAEVAAATEELGALLDGIAVGGVQDEFSRCLEATKGIKPPVRLRVSPGSVLQIRPGETARVSVTGSTTRPTWSALWSSNIKIQVTEVGTTGPLVLDIAVDATVAPQTYFLSIRGDDDVEKTVRIEVLSKAAVTGGAPAAPPPAPPLAAAPPPAAPAPVAPAPGVPAPTAPTPTSPAPTASGATTPALPGRDPAAESRIKAALDGKLRVFQNTTGDWVIEPGIKASHFRLAFTQGPSDAVIGAAAKAVALPSATSDGITVGQAGAYLVVMVRYEDAKAVVEAIDAGKWPQPPSG